jgi:hypothetical protein
MLSAIGLGGSSCDSGDGGAAFQAGTLTVQIAGLASNADANVTVSSGGVSQLVTSSQTLSLTPGQYTVSAEPVLTGQSVMGPTAPNQQVTVAAGQTATVTVSYNTLRALALRLVEVIGGGLEVWALGLRNPWRWAFDNPANLIYIADVGQNRFEEVNVAVANAAGRNYGWAITDEGNACFPSDPCDRAGQTLPVLVYDHSAREHDHLPVPPTPACRSSNGTCGSQRSGASRPLRRFS